MDASGEILYVGKARNLKNRVASYFRGGKGLGEKTRAMVSQITLIQIHIVESELDALLLEANLVKKHAPKFNIRLTDGKAYPLIRITKGDMYPKVLIARRPDDTKSVYFGPFPNSGAMKMVLKIVRRIFPYQSVNNHPKRVCLYHHLGLCPCPPVFDSAELQKEYKRNIRHLMLFLEGKRNEVQKDLEKERDIYTKSEQFEQAQKIQKQIDAIASVTQATRKPFEYEMNPNLRNDLRQQELTELAYHLRQVGVDAGDIRKIECYDISNISGTNAVGSLIVFVDGEKDSSQYRRFKISKDIIGPNDFAMMQEVLRRRLKHDEWPLPDLFVVDGGKGQISSAKQALDQAGITIPLVGLAKRNEIIITSDFRQIILPKRSPALQLMQRIRNEAHRFAITYHKKLRAKAFLQK